MNEDLTMDSLIGLKINSAKINEDKDIVLLETDQGNYFLSWVGDCCAHCFIAGISGTDILIGSTITAIENSKWRTIQDDDSDVIESMGSKITTSKGYLSIDTRVEHNGYYGGEIEVSKDQPVRQYGTKAEFDPKQYKELKDF